jgi:nucleoside-diphosphate-sugar epimerase
MSGLTVIFGAGAVGRPVAEILLARGDKVRIAQRNPPKNLAAAEYTPCDVLDLPAVHRAVAGATQVVLAFGFPYDSRVWAKTWPKAMANILAACAEDSARVVFLDNLYQLGPQNAPRREDMPLTRRGGKPGVLADVTRLWMGAGDRVKVAALRCTDFYGPGVEVSHIGATGFGEIAKGKPAMMLAPPDTPHDFAYVPDIARAIVTLLDAPDDAFGQAWNMPCAPTRTPREILQIGAAALGVPLKVTAIPLWSAPILGLFMRFMKEVADVGFTWDRPYVVDARKFKTRFWSDVTPFEVGAVATARAFAEAAKSS